MEKKKKDPFEEAVEILKGYYKGLPKHKTEACCSGCEPEEKTKKKTKKKLERTPYEAEY
ncbi:MAG: hypothetical protein WC595_01790 [Candidatus Nanoarchaeia archaeon]